MIRRNSVLALGLGALLVTSTGCTSDSYLRDNHWRSSSIGPRFVYAMTGYRPESGATYRDFSWRERLDINLTFQRHFLNHNPENPFQPVDPFAPFFDDYGKEPAPVSIWPQPLNYFHLSSVVAGGVISAVTTSQTFVPIPFDSLIGLFERGGTEEFLSGINGADEDRTSRHTRRVPPSIDDFQLSQEDTPEFIDL